MNDYNFSTLNDREFEELTKDLLNAEFKLGLKSFPAGRDQGIDLRKSTSKNKNSIVVQVKHYINSTVSSFKNTLKNDELKKVTQIKPDRYIVVTSLKLSAKQRDEIKVILQPYLVSDDDLYSQNDLNELLSKHKNIEKRYYKLWLSSLNILNGILNNAIESRSEYFLEQLSRKMKFYVPTNKINNANEILKNEKILLITGEPGIGKTTLSEILLFNRAKWGYKIHVVEDIVEAEDIISPDKKEKQIFYFDDFLGANYTEIINSHKTETRLTNFVERIYNSPNKYIILTTRTVVLNLATDNYEKINNSKLNVGKFELKIDDYTRYEKAQILYNHLYFHNLEKKYLDVILKDKYYFHIIQHESYRPRIIEFITDKSKIKGFTGSQYRQFIHNNLENPEGIWSFSFNNQINYLDRCFLLSLFTYEHYCDESVLKEAFSSRLEYEKKINNQIVETNQYLKSLKVLSNGFITITTTNYNNRIQKSIRFINPSLADFLINYVSNSSAEISAILHSVKHSKQLERFNPKLAKFTLDKDHQIIIRNKIDKREILDILEDKNDNYIKTISILLIYCPEINVDHQILENLTKIDFKSEWSYTVSTNIIDHINQFEEDLLPQSYFYVKQNFENFIIKILESIDNELYAQDIIDSFEKYNISLLAFRQSEKGLNAIKTYINTSVENEYSERKETLDESIEDMEDIKDVLENAEYRSGDLLNTFGIEQFSEIFSPELDEDYWNEKIEYNRMKNQIFEEEKKEYKYEGKTTKSNGIAYENRLIERLFGH